MSTADRERADELRLLALGLLDRAEPAVRGLLAGLQQAPTPAAERPIPPIEPTEPPSGRPAGEATACGWCPLCATVGLLRGERPELAAAITAHADGLLAALRAALTPDPSAPTGRAGSSGPFDGPDPAGSGQGQAGATRRVQHIDVHAVGAGC